MKQSLIDLPSIFGGYDFACACCGADTFDGNPFCLECRKNAPLNNGKTCAKCGTAIDGEENYCSKCGKREVYFDRAYSVYLLEGNVHAGVLRIKYGNDLRPIRNFALQMADYFVKTGEQWDITTFVPLSQENALLRGYNQSHLLAEDFCDILKIQPPQQLLIKIKETPKQEDLSYQQRLTNLKGAFALSDGADVKNKNILLIDDVLTTGATASYCAKALKSKGAARVTVLTLSSRKEIFHTESKDE